MDPSRTPPVAPGVAYAGCYTDGDQAGPGGAVGISLLRHDPASGALALLEAFPSRNPSFLALHPRLPVLYAVCETDGPDGSETAGAIEAHAVDPATGRLTLLGRQPSAGAGPTHLAVDPAARALVVANYQGGTFALLPLAPDGRLLPVSQTLEPTGTGPNPDRQDAPHPHGAAWDPAGRHVALADLGTDQILLFRLDDGGGGVAEGAAGAEPPSGVGAPSGTAATSPAPTPNPQPPTPSLDPSGPPSAPSATPPPPRLVQTGEAKAAPGAGPRHLAFHPNGRFLYCVNELIPSVAVYPYDPDRGTLGPALQTLPTVPPEAAPGTGPAEVVVHPTGRLLYASNRRLPGSDHPLADSIAAFALDPATGLLAPLGHTAGGISSPRHLALDPSGSFLYASNQKGDTIAPFRLDPATGALTPTGDLLSTPTPVCLVFTDR